MRGEQNNILFPLSAFNGQHFSTFGRLFDLTTGGKWQFNNAYHFPNLSSFVPPLGSCSSATPRLN